MRADIFEPSSFYLINTNQSIGWRSLARARGSAAIMIAPSVPGGLEELMMITLGEVCGIGARLCPSLCEETRDQKSVRLCYDLSGEK